jgi:hypothetical protein
MTTRHAFLRYVFCALAISSSACSSSNEPNEPSEPAETVDASTGTDAAPSNPSGPSDAGDADADAGDPDSPLGKELFAASGFATPFRTLGVWAGASSSDGPMNFDVRLRLTAGERAVAVRCTNTENGEAVIVAATSNARNSATEFSWLEASVDERKRNGTTCRVRLSPMTISACPEAGVRTNCFHLTGTTLTFYAASSAPSVYTKVSD